MIKFFVKLFFVLELVMTALCIFACGIVAATLIGAILSHAFGVTLHGPELWAIAKAGFLAALQIPPHIWSLDPIELWHRR
jgi:hypothetical protein